MKKINVKNNIKMNNKLNVYYMPNVRVEMTVHDFHNGSEQQMSIDEYAGCEVDKNGITRICWYTGWDDNPVDSYPIRETKEEVDALYTEGKRIQQEEYKKITIVSKDWKTQMIDDIGIWITNNINTYVTEAGIDVNKFVNDLKQKNL